MGNTINNMPHHDRFIWNGAVSLNKSGTILAVGYPEAGAGNNFMFNVGSVRIYEYKVPSVEEWNSTFDYVGFVKNSILN